MYKKGGALKSFNMIEGGYLKNMGAISGVWKKFGIKNNFSSTAPSNLNYDWSLN